MNNKGYIAGKLFKQADIKQRLYEGELVKEQLPEVDFYNPIENDEINDKSNLPTAKDIFYGDTDRVVESKYILAELDDEDSGTMYELGVCSGIEIMRSKIKELAKENSLISVESLLDLLEDEVPQKRIFAHLSDIRLGTANQYEGRYIPHGINQYVVGGIEEIGAIFSSVEDAIEGIRKEITLNKRGDI